MSQSLKTPRIAVVGGGVYGSAMLKCFAALQRQGLVELAALAETDEDILGRHVAALGLAGYTDYRQMFGNAGLDAVAVATPDHLHAELVLAAAAAGLHVLVQKPLATDSQSARQMVAACRARGLLLFVDFHKRFDPAHMRLKTDLQAGRLGKIQYGHVCMEDKIVVPTQWLRKWAARSSPSWFLGVHFYDLVYWLLQSRPRRVYASGHSGKLQSMGLDALDSVCARVEYANGATFSFDLSWILPAAFPSIVNQQLRMVGQEGLAEIDSQERGMFSACSDTPESLVINPFGAQEYQHPVWGAQLQGYTFASMQRFVELLGAIHSGRATLAQLGGKYPDGEDALVATETGEAVDRSMAAGTWIEL